MIFDSSRRTWSFKASPIYNFLQIERNRRYDGTILTTKAHLPEWQLMRWMRRADKVKHNIPKRHDPRGLHMSKMRN